LRDRVMRQAQHCRGNCNYGQSRRPSADHWWSSLSYACPIIVQSFGSRRLHS
jgi:hypothetical protein